MAAESASIISFRMIFVALVLAFAMAQEVTRTNSVSSRPRISANSGAVHRMRAAGSKRELMIGLQSQSQTWSDNPVYHLLVGSNLPDAGF
jgi:hypothetical protein